MTACSVLGLSSRRPKFRGSYEVHCEARPLFVQEIVIGYNVRLLDPFAPVYHPHRKAIPNRRGHSEDLLSKLEKGKVSALFESRRH